MILDRLRQATRPQHEALEAVVPLGQENLPLALYGQVLTRFRGFYVTWETAAAAAAAPALAPIVRARRKLPLLDDDLHSLGLRPGYDAAMDSAWLPDLAAGDAILLGSMYVVEGATLGGQVISRSLERSSGFRDGRGYSFFQSYGKATGQQWKSFVALIEALPDEESNTVVAAAQKTFRAFHQWFVEPALLDRAAGG
jgi:heme oxygenase